MCFDATTSAITFSATTLSAIYLYNRGYKTNNKNDKFFSLLVLLIGFMQLIEYFIWKNQNCNSMNHLFSILIIVLLTIQPILCYNWYYYLHKNTTGLSHNLVLLYSIIFFCYNVYIINWLNQTQLCSKPTKRSCRLNLNNDDFHKHYEKLLDSIDQTDTLIGYFSKKIKDDAR